MTRDVSVGLSAVGEALGRMPGGAWMTEPATVEELRAHVRRLTDLLDHADWPGDEAFCHHLRAVARSRLIQAAPNDGAGADEAREAWADALAAIGLLRDLVMQGHSDVKTLLSEAVQRLATILSWRPDRGDEYAATFEDILSDALSLMAANDVLTSASGRLAYVLIEIAATPERRHGGRSASRVLAAAQRWTDRAVVALDTLEGPGYGLALGHVVPVIGASLSEAARQVDADDNRWQLFFPLAARRWTQLEQIDTSVDWDADISPREIVAGATGLLVTAVYDAVNRIASKFNQPIQPVVMFAEANLLRRAIYQLPSTLWRRDRSCYEIFARESPGVSDPRGILQTFLDWTETVLLAGSMAGIRGSFAEDANASDLEDEEFGPELSSAALTIVATTDPRPTVAHLTAAIHYQSDGEAPLDKVEQEITDYLREFDLAAGKANAEGDQRWRRLLFELMSIVYEWQTSPLETDALQEEIDRIMADLCLAPAPHDVKRCCNYAAILFNSVTDTFGYRSPADALEVLASLERAERQLRELGEDSPVLESARAHLAFFLAQSDRSWSPRAYEFASRFVRHVEEQPDLPADGTPFDADSLVQCLRLIGITRDRAAAVGLPQAAEWGDSDDVIARLLQLAEDPRIAAESRRKANAHANELRILRLAAAEDRPALLARDWGPLIETRPVAYLASLVRATDEERDRAFDRELVDRAVRQTLRIGRGLHDVSEEQGRYLQLLTTEETAERLGLSGDQRLAIGRLAARALDPASPAAADLALQVVVNLQTLRLTPEWAEDYSVLAEDVAERYLARALEVPEKARGAAPFLLGRASAGLNLGAVRAAEHRHRLGVAVAAHLLAVRHKEQHLAAWSAYIVAEFLRLSGNPTGAGPWLAVYDEWRARGGLAGEKYAELRAGIEYDREQLRAALALGGGEGGPAGRDA